MLLNVSSAVFPFIFVARTKLHTINQLKGDTVNG